MKYETNNYELAKQDMTNQEKNLVVEHSDLVKLLRPERAQKR